MATSIATASTQEPTPAKLPSHCFACCVTSCPTGGPFLGSVVLMALVGLLDAGRVLLIRPIFDRVLNPSSQGEADSALQSTVDGPIP